MPAGYCIYLIKTDSASQLSGEDKGPYVADEVSEDEGDISLTEDHREAMFFETREAAQAWGDEFIWVRFDIDWFPDAFPSMGMSGQCRNGKHLGSCWGGC